MSILAATRGIQAGRLIVGAFLQGHLTETAPQTDKPPNHHVSVIEVSLKEETHGYMKPQSAAERITTVIESFFLEVLP